MSRKQQLFKVRCGIPQGGHNKIPFAGRNLKLEIEYDGTNYAGWQIQDRSQKKTIQETLEKTLRKILQEKIRLIASGRTDAGVHALGQIANFKTRSSISLDKLQKALNSLLPDDIVIKKIEEKDLSFHSRFGAKSKIYRYTILNGDLPSAFLRNRAYFYHYPLDLGLMRKEARAILGRHDFSAFSASGSGANNKIRTIKRISIKEVSYQPLAIPACPAGRSHQLKDSYLLAIDIEADGFLYSMVRNIVGTLLEIGRGRFAKGSLKIILRSKDRKLAGPTVPACGLYLCKVNY